MLPQLEKAPVVGGGLCIVIEERQTPACCVGDSLKECQHKHSQTTCSPRAEGLASLQAHLHTIPQLRASQPRRQTGAKEGETSSQTERTCSLCVTDVSVITAMTSARNDEKQPAVRGSQQPPPCMQSLCCVLEGWLPVCTSVSQHKIHMAASAWLKSLTGDRFLYKSSHL